MGLIHALKSALQALKHYTNRVHTKEYYATIETNEVELLVQIENILQQLLKEKSKVQNEGLKNKKVGVVGHRQWRCINCIDAYKLNYTHWGNFTLKEPDTPLKQCCAWNEHRRSGPIAPHWVPNKNIEMAVL